MILDNAFDFILGPFGSWKKTALSLDPFDMEGGISRNARDAIKIEDISVKNKFDLFAVRLFLDFFNKVSEHFIEEKFSGFKFLPQGVLGMNRLGLAQMQVTNNRGELGFDPLFR